MADIKIKKSEQETIFEATGINTIDAVLLKGLFGLGGSTTEEADRKETVFPIDTDETDFDTHYNMRAFRPVHITPAILKAAINEERLDSVLQPFDEIDIPLDTGETVTVVCAYVEPEWARFVFKDCWDEGVMNDEATNKTGYFKSKGRAHVLTDILPRIVQEWRAIFNPRQMVEEIDGELVEYADLLWLPSATDVFGPSEEGYWKDLGDNFQLPIFRRERDRVKECGDKGTYPWWLRSGYASYTYNFCYVNTDGGANNNVAYFSYGFAPGFDI